MLICMTEFQKYIQRYLDLIPSENWVEEMKISGEKTLEIYDSLTPTRKNTRTQKENGL